LASQESATSKKAKKGIRTLLRELSDDEDNTTDSHPDVVEDLNCPWSQHFEAYMNASEDVPDGWSAIKWWGVSGCFSKAYG
jgi:hypothetical protein